MRVDVHCHLLPGIDDGSRSIHETLEMARALVDLGYSRVAATPHIRPGVWSNKPTDIATLCGEVAAALEQAKIPLALTPGAEHFFDAELEGRLEKPRGWGKAGAAFLVELPHNAPPPPALAQVFFRLRVKGFKLLLAHPERYREPKKWLGALRDQGILAQVSLTSLGGKFGASSQNQARALVEAELADIVATDAHKVADVLLAKEGLKWLERAVGGQEALRLTAAAPTALLDN